MNEALSWQVALGLSLLCAIGAAFLLPIAQRGAQVEQRIRQTRTPGSAARGGAAQPRCRYGCGRSSAVGHAVIGSGLLSRKAIEDLEQTMAASGHRAGAALSLFIGAKLALLVGLPLLALDRAAGHRRGRGSGRSCRWPPPPWWGSCCPTPSCAASASGTSKAVETGLPSALDLLIICAEAGLALEAGFERVADEAQEGAPRTANELRITANEMKILSDRRQALVNMGKPHRSRIDGPARRHAGAEPEIRHPADPGAARARRRDAADDAEPLRGTGGADPGAADHSDDRVHPALHLRRGRRPGRGAGVGSPMSTLLHWLSDKAGIVALEFALIGPAFLGLMVLLFELSFLLYAQTALDFAAREAARNMFNRTGHGDELVWIPIAGILSVPQPVSSLFRSHGGAAAGHQLPNGPYNHAHVPFCIGQFRQPDAAASHLHYGNPALAAECDEVDRNGRVLE